MESPRASWLNVLASAPMSVLGLASSATAIEPAKTINNANATTGAGLLGAGLLGFDGTNYRRLFADTLGADAVVLGTNILLAEQAFNLVWNGTTWDRMKSANGASGTTGTGLLGVNPLLWDGTNFQRQPSLGLSDGTNAAIPTSGISVQGSTGLNFAVYNPANNGDANAASHILSSQPYLFNGTTFDRTRSANGAQNTTGTGLLGAGLMAWDGTNWQRVNAFSVNSDGWSGAVNTELGVVSFPQFYNGTSYDRSRNNAAANIDDTTQPFQMAVAEPGEWTVDSSVAAAGTPSASKALGAAGVRHVCRNISVSLANTGAASALVTVVLRDGASGAGTVKRTWQFVVPAAATINVDVAGLNIFGGTATAMTLESAAALPAAVSGVCSIAGYSTI